LIISFTFAFFQALMPLIGCVVETVNLTSNSWIDSDTTSDKKFYKVSVGSESRGFQIKK